ncbi:MAG: Hsp20/alpha crystallin family protein [bacterium]|nr:Hsp20/alpha crystallin family protein [bacterium]
MFENALTRVTKSPFISARDPFHGLFDRVFDNVWNDSDFVAGESGRRTWLPAVDIKETDEAFVATADLPGLKKDDIDVSIEDNVLTVSGERKFEDAAEGTTFRRVERAYGSFRRSFTLPRGVDSVKVEARFEDGVLMLQIPKSEVAKSRKITVS